MQNIYVKIFLITINIQCFYNKMSFFSECVKGVHMYKFLQSC